MLALLLWLAFAYLIAATPFGLLIGRLRGVDLREVGSGNIGATNAVRALGRKLGLVVFALDVGKAALPVALALHHFEGHPQRDGFVALIGLAAILGHVFPVWLRFQGGKGVACAFGVFLVLVPKAALVALVVYLQTLALSRLSALGSLTAGTVMLGIALTDPTLPRSWAVLCLALTGLLWWRHLDNLGRLLVLARDNKQREAELARQGHEP